MGHDLFRTAVALLLAFTGTAFGQTPTLFVAPPPAGNDSNIGSQAAPMATIGRAAGAASAGTVIRIAAGIYAERVVVPIGGAVGAPVIFRGEAGAIVDGTAVPIPDTGAGLFEIDGKSHVRVEGLRIRGWKTEDRSKFPMGFYVHDTAGPVEGVQLISNVVEQIEMRNKEAGAHAIGIYGRRAAGPIRGLRLEENDVRSCKLGFSEAVVVNGNVAGFEIIGNRIRDCDNIGIDLIGGEKTCTDPASDRAREGRIVENVVSDISTEGNLAYPAGDLSAGGIYVDGGSDLVIERNTVLGCDLGIEVAPENRN